MGYSVHGLRVELPRVRTGTACLAKAWNANVTVTCQYDERGRLTNLTRLIDGVSYPISYVYDAAGNLTQLTGPDGVPVTYTYTEQNQPKTVAGFVNDAIEYYDAGPVKRIVYANGVVACALLVAFLGGILVVAFGWK